MTTLTTRAQRIIEARALGRDHAHAAASWIIDGNTPADHIERLVQMFDDGDPAIDAYLPRRPDLSGEWADDFTPARLAEACGGWTAGLCDAYEAAVSDAFEDECERIVRAAVA